MMNGEKYVSLESGDQWQASLKIQQYAFSGHFAVRLRSLWLVIFSAYPHISDKCM